MPISKSPRNAAPSRQQALGDQICQILEEISLVGQRIGVQFSPGSPKSLNSLRSLPHAVLAEMAANLCGYLEILTSVDPELPKENFERELLKNALDALQLEAPSDFLWKVKENDICEIYDLESKVQIFRNLEFLKYSSYDLATVLSNRWTDLFFRRPEIDIAIEDRARHVTLNSTTTEPWGVQNHVLTEMLHKENQEFFIYLGNIAPVFDKKTGARKAWVSTIQVRPLGSAYRHMSNVTPI